jgi:hypothetical protein
MRGALCSLAPLLRGEGRGVSPREQVIKLKDLYPSPGSHLRCDPISPRKRGEVKHTRCPSSYDRDHPSRRASACAAPNGAGVNGPGGALVISITKPRPATASQNVSQKPSI